MYTRFFGYNAEKYLHQKGNELHKNIKGCFSMFAFNKDTNTIYIYTTHPGMWIGRAGTDIAKVKEDLQKMFPHPIDVAIIETTI